MATAMVNQLRSNTDASESASRQRREGEQHVRDGRDRAVGEAAVEAGDESAHGADHGGEGDRDDGDQRRVGDARSDAENTSATELVRPNQCTAEGRLQARRRILGERVEGQQPERRDEAEHREQHDDDEAGEPATAAQQEAHALHGAPAAGGEGRGLRDVGHAARTRGSMTR